MKKCIREAGGLIADMFRLSMFHNVPRASGALAFFLLTSFFPLLMCANAVLGILHVDVQHLITSLDRFLPQQAAGPELRALQQHQTQAVAACRRGGLRWRRSEYSL